MKKLPLMALAAVAALGAALADETPVYTTATLTYSIDTVSESPYAVKTATEASSLAALVYDKGSVVRATNPNTGATTTLVSAGATAGTYAWSPTEGGAWVLLNSADGTAVFNVRYSIFGTQGAGTAGDPAKIVDGTEIADLVDAGVAGDGYVFDYLGGDIGSLARPSGFAVLSVGDGLWRLAATASGLVSVSETASFVADTETFGPNRRVRGKHAVIPPISYTGDRWVGNASAASTLTLTPPTGDPIALPLFGTDDYELPLSDDYGIWNLELVYGTTVLNAVINYDRNGLILVFR